MVALCYTTFIIDETLTLTSNPSTTSQNAVSMSVVETKLRIDAYIEAVLTERIVQADKISSDYGQLWRTIANLMRAGGKRLRPYVTFLAYNLDGNHDAIEDILPAATAQEMIHTAMLIHDDIIDRDYIRYGVKNVSGQYNKLYEPYVDDRDERMHFSNSAAIMAGDLLIAEAYSLIQRCNVDSAQIAKAQTVLTEAIFRVVGGELLDTESAFRPFEQVDALTIATQKTASYSFVSPLTMGAQLAGMPEASVEVLTKFGTALGIAYQLKDDILGAFGDEAVTGKSNSGDIREGKHTYLVEQFYATASTEQKEQFAPIFKNDAATKDDIVQARQLLIDSGAKQATNEAIDSFATEARSQLDQLDITEDARLRLNDLIERCIHRVK